MDIAHFEVSHNAVAAIITFDRSAPEDAVMPDRLVMDISDFTLALEGGTAPVRLVHGVSREVWNTLLDAPHVLVVEANPKTGLAVTYEVVPEAR